MPHQPSFRRLLLTRLLVFSIPILLVGMGMTYRTMRATLIEAASRRLSEQADDKAQEIQSSLRALESQLAIASQTDELRSSFSPSTETYLRRLAQQIPTVRCLQIINISSGEIELDTCDLDSRRVPEEADTVEDGIIALPPENTWTEQEPNRELPPRSIAVISKPNPRLTPNRDEQTNLELVVSLPIYNNRGRLRSMLSAQTVLPLEQQASPPSFTVVIDQESIFRAHPFPDRVGERTPNDPYRSLFRSAFSEGDGVLPVIDFTTNGTPWLPGLSPMPVRTDPETEELWTLLTVTPVEIALEPLEPVRRMMIGLMMGLLSTYVVVTLFVSRGLARPIERLERYARDVQDRDTSEPVPSNLGVKELNHLAAVLDDMVRRLEERAAELESAWHEAESANRMKSEFLATTSHELRTPLNAIVGCLQLVTDGYCESEEEEKELLSRADRAAIHLLKIINDLLDIRSAEEGKIRLYMDNVNVHQAIHEVIDLQRLDIERKNLKLEVSDLHSPIFVRADVDRLKQVLLNIIANAVKFTDSGSITIETEVTSQAPSEIEDVHALMDVPRPQTNGEVVLEEKRYVSILVQDTGVGIAPEEQAKLFRPFCMVDSSTTRKFEGTGLGLAIARKLIERMGGSIILRSEGEAMGTTVKVILPVLQLTPTQSPEGSGRKGLSGEPTFIQSY
ncbi:sensor histidine kinase [Vacuolonema iberomarrocanum]|uniref:sensor histidine kinase n=1 Tax=Vacuolonema iberomarrocanum TaxID=3454632 RepID=UPI001A0AEF09|nr:HAMP domain-containing histidine kinase [filamentous cyanobacterium LEGE 07170]